MGTEADLARHGWKITVVRGDVAELAVVRGRVLARFLLDYLAVADARLAWPGLAGLVMLAWPLRHAL
jgi:hypothetical protein